MHIDQLTIRRWVQEANKATDALNAFIATLPRRTYTKPPAAKPLTLSQTKLEIDLYLYYRRSGLDEFTAEEKTHEHLRHTPD